MPRTIYLASSTSFRFVFTSRSELFETRSLNDGSGVDSRACRLKRCRIEAEFSSISICFYFSLRSRLFASTLKVVFTFLSLLLRRKQKKKIENFKTQFSTINFNKRSFSSPTALCTELSPSSSCDVFAAAMNGLRWSVREVENYRENYFAMLLDEGENFSSVGEKEKNFTETNLRVNATIEREILRMRADFQEFSNFFIFVLFKLKIENIFHKLFPMLARKTN